MATSPNLTPMMRQYLEAKRQCPDAILFFRMGDFYEMFYEDAQVAAKILGLTLTSRSKGPDAVPMAGVPYHAAEGYIRRLINAGKNVAICEQVQDPREAKGLVQRQIVRLVTPGTVLEDALLEEKTNNYIAAIVASRNLAGLSWADLSTGEFYVQEIPIESLLDELSRLQPSECLVPEKSLDENDELARTAQNLEGMTITPHPDWAFGRDTARRTLLEHFGVQTLEGFGCQDMGPAICAAGAIIHYLQETQRGALPHLQKLVRFDRSDCLVLDRVAQRNLELTETLQGRERRGSLLWVLDRTETPMGGRLLRQWLLAPLRDIDRINARLDAVEELVQRSDVREQLSGALDNVYDMARLATRVGCNRATPRDLIALKQSLEALPMVKHILDQRSSTLLRDIGERVHLAEDARVLIATAIAPDPPLSPADGGVIRAGFNHELDEIRSIATDNKMWLARFQAREIQRTGINNLKVGYNKVFGYYIEVTNANRDQVPPDYIRKQTLKSAERYITPELKEYETRVLTAEERMKDLERQLFQEVCDEVAKYIGVFQETADALAEIDVLLSLAKVAVENRYTRPEVEESLRLIIRDGRHPVLERTLVDQEFVPNDIALGPDKCRVIVLTGPNMAGKSTYIRQVALITIMAQMGSFVPAKEAVIGVVDRVFARVGASDELARGQSTFMVEMTETANILNNASARSLIILDEVGRGTSTFDGVSIAWAVTEYICTHLGARTLFATHYHEMTDLSKTFPYVKNFNVAVRETRGKVIFLHKIVPGGTDKSYGVHVAALAGVPQEVVERAKSILANLEQIDIDVSGHPQPVRPRRSPRVRRRQLLLNMDFHHPIVDELQKIDVAQLSPEEAKAILEQLKEKAKE